MRGLTAFCDGLCSVLLSPFSSLKQPLSDHRAYRHRPVEDFEVMQSAEVAPNVT